MKSIGQRIKFLREEKNWQQRKLAYYLDIDVSILSKVENGQLPKKNMESILKGVSEFSGVPFEELEKAYKAELIFNIIHEIECYEEVLNLASKRVRHHNQQLLTQEKIKFNEH